MNAIIDHHGHQIVIYPFNAVDDDPESGDFRGFSIFTVFRYLMDGKESGLCYGEYREALEAAMSEALAIGETK